MTGQQARGTKTRGQMGRPRRDARILAVLSEKDFENLLAWGLASVALALLLTDLGWDRKYGGSMARRSSGP